MYNVVGQNYTADLEAFKQLASYFRSAQERVRDPLKRPKCTSSDIRMSPNIARETPRFKLSRKRLEFNSKLHTSFHEESKIIHESMLFW